MTYYLKTLKSNTGKLYRYVQYGKLENCDDIDIDDCKFSVEFKLEYQDYLNNSDLASQVGDGEDFLAYLIPESGPPRRIGVQCRRDGDNLRVNFPPNTEKDIPNNSIVILRAWMPPQPPEYYWSGDGLVWTSDGVLSLEDGDLITCKDGEVSKITLQDLLLSISKLKTKKSPSYSELKVVKSKGRPTRPSQGTIIYNDLSGRLEIYTKDGWKGLKYEDS